jgi:LysR family transcriptional regulator, regulator for metE and metH
MDSDASLARRLQLDLRHLRLVAAVAESGGQTRAARKLNLTQSALSHQLRELETRVGAPVFIRASRRMVLTPLGERVLATARRVLHEVETLEHDLTTEAAMGGAGVVRLATECYTCYHWLPAVVTAFRQEWPRVDVRIVAEATADPVRALLDGALDLAIVAGDVDERRLGCTALFEDEQVVVVAPDHPFATRAFIAPLDLRNEHLILYTTHSSENSVLREVLRPAGVEPRQLTRVQLTEAIVELVKAGLGISVLARWAIAPQLRDGSLVGIPLTARGFHRRWWAVTRPHEAAPAYRQSLLELLGRHLRGGPSPATDLLPPSFQSAASGSTSPRSGRAIGIGDA